MNILITGASGFIGRYLHQFLTQKYTNATVVSLAKPSVDLLDLEGTKQAFHSLTPDWIFHLAGRSQVTEESGLEGYFFDNFIATANLLDAVQASPKPIKIFFASSVHVYGHQSVLVDESSPLKPISQYGFTKYLAEQLLKDFATKNPKHSVVIGRLYNCIGPGQPLGFVVSDWCHRLAKLAPGKKMTLNVGPLNGFRYFLDVRDAVEIFPLLLEKSTEPFSTVNIASDAPTPLKVLLDQLVKISGRIVQITADTGSGHNRFLGLRVSNVRLKTLLEDVHFRKLDVTLQEMWKASQARS